MSNKGYYVAFYHDDDDQIYKLGELDGNEALSLLYTLYALQPEITQWQKSHNKQIDPERIHVEWVESC